MRKSSRALAIGFLLATLTTLPALGASEPLFTFEMQEYYAGGRPGVIRIYDLGTASPYAGDPSYAPYNTNLWVESAWSSVGACGSSYLAGGTQEGWLLGPETDIDAIRTFHPTATLAFGVFTPPGTAVRYSCDGAKTEEWSFLLAFIFPQAIWDEARGQYWVGDALYATDLNDEGNWFTLYSAQPVM